MTPLRIGTRGSALATTQTTHVAETLTERSGPVSYTHLTLPTKRIV